MARLSATGTVSAASPRRVPQPPWLCSSSSPCVPHSVGCQGPATRTSAWAPVLEGEKGAGRARGAGCGAHPGQVEARELEEGPGPAGRLSKAPAALWGAEGRWPLKTRGRREGWVQGGAAGAAVGGAGPWVGDGLLASGGAWSGASPAPHAGSRAPQKGAWGRGLPLLRPLPLWEAGTSGISALGLRQGQLVATPQGRDVLPRPEA